MPSIYSHINATYLHYLVLVPGSQTIQQTFSIRPISPKNKTLQSGLPKEEFQKTDICERLVILFPENNLFWTPPPLYKCYFLGFPNEKFSLVCDKLATD